jgi:putative protein-disulfide isomerase
MSATLFYVHDPMCSWCWGHRPQWLQLQASLPKGVVVKNVVGGLAPDSDEIMPQAQQQAIAGYWQNIENLLGTQFNHDFWRDNKPRRSTYPACRAVIAARWQNREEDMMQALQEAYYLKAQNPSDIAVHIKLASEIGLDSEQFATDLASGKLEQTFIQELQFARSLPINGFPSMVLQHNGEVDVIPLDYQDCRGAIETITNIISQG